jgi:soluble lytic murein transglycosylase-like protein
MAKLPDANDIGRRAPQISGGVASADTGAVARAMQGLGQAVASTAGAIGEKQDRFNYAEAQSDFLKKKLEIMSSFDGDNDYSTFGDRYNEKIKQARQESANLLRNNDDRHLFEIETNNDISRGLDQIRGLARNKEVDHGIATLNSTIESNRNAALNAPDESTRQAFLKATSDAVQGAFDRGYINEQTLVNTRQKAAIDYATSSIGMMKPEQQISALRDSSGMASILPPDTRKKMMDAAAVEVVGNRINDAQMRLMNPGGISGYTVGPIPEEDLFAAVVGQESGGRQFGNDGKPLTSSAGAIGVAQVMPGTAPEAAKLAGMPWDEQRYKNDTSYNHALGKAYLNQQLKKYNGNPVLALAAYNAGPGKVDEWINQIGDPRKGEITNEGFANSIPYGETQNYVASVMSNAAKVNVTKNVIESPEFGMLDAQQKARVVEQTYNVIDTAASAQRFNQQQRMQDDVARIDAGQVVENPVSPLEYMAAMPLNSTPAQRTDAAQKYDQYRQILALQPAYQAIISSPADVGVNTVNALRPQAGDSDFEFKQKRYSMAAQKLQQTLTAREKDPGGWMVQNDPQVQSVYQQYQQDPSQGAQLAHQIEMQKQRLGIKSKDVLPESLADNLLQQINTNQEQDVAAIQGIGQQFGQYAPLVMQQVQKKAGPVLQVVMATSNPRAANALWQNRDVKTSELKDAVNTASSGASDSADSEWASQSKDFAGTMVVQPGGIPIWNNFNDQGRRLTYLNMQKGMSASDAAAQAYQDVLGSQYQTKDTWRLPVASNVDIKDVSDGVSRYMETMKPEDITPLLGDPRLSVETNRKQSLDRIKDNGEWVTNADETGLMLTLNGLVVSDASGNPVQVPFNQLAQLGSTNRSYFNSLSKDASKIRTYVPGQAARESKERNENMAQQLGNLGNQNAPSMAEGMRSTNADLYQRAGSGDKPANQ